MKTKYTILMMVLVTLGCISCNRSEQGYKGPARIAVPDHVVDRFSTAKFLLDEPQITYGKGYAKVLVTDYEACNKYLLEFMEQNPELDGVQLNDIFLECDFVYFNGYGNNATVNSKGNFTIDGGRDESVDQSTEYIHEKKHTVQNEWIKVNSSYYGNAVNPMDYNQNQLNISVTENNTGKPRQFSVYLSKMNGGSVLDIYQDPKSD